MFLMPVITTQPRTPVEACVNGSVKLSVAATNASGYQWKRGGVNVSDGSGGTSATHTTGIFTTNYASYAYTVVVSNGTGPGSCTVTSNEATVRVYPPTAPGSTVTFANFHPCSAPVGSTWSLLDTREQSNPRYYKVRMMADQRVWMVQDLKFGDKCTKETFNWSATTDQTGNLSTYFPGYYGDCTNKKESTTPANRGYLYDWAAAVNHAGAFFTDGNTSYYLGCGYAETNKIDGPEPPRNLDPNACQGICPAGWHIPTGNNQDGVVGEIADANTKFQTAYNCTGAACWNASSQWEGVIGGYIQYGSIVAPQRASYWSSTRAGNAPAFMLGFNDTVDGTVSPGYKVGINDIHYVAYKNSGRTVRCIRNYY
jgi:uncharacterized protein (TIGR02145 family)